MSRSPLLLSAALLVAASCAGCAARTDAASSVGAVAPGAAPLASAPLAAAVSSAAPTTLPAPPPPSSGARTAVHEPPPAFVAAMTAAGGAITARDFAAADRALDAASAAAAGELSLRYGVARLRATRFAYAADFEQAAAAFLAILPELATHADSADEFWAHNAMMMIREAEGDPAAALAENDQATLAAARGTWQPEQRETLAYLKDRWHRAYLTRMLAESRKGSVRRALILYAEAALDEYRTRARQLGSNEDSIAVLEAYFAALDGRRDAALAAAKKVDPAKDDDLEDLYLVVGGLEAGGDHASAEAVRRAMRAPGGAHVSRAIMLRWLDHDSKAPRDRTFSPYHAS